MARYALSNTQGTPQAIATGYKTQWDLTARRAWIYDVTFGTDGTPLDNTVTCKIDRQTTTGTRTTATPAPLDVVDPAAAVTAGVCTTVEPTVTANTQLLEIGMNQRTTYRWVASPGGELVVPSNATTGLGGRMKSPTGYVGTAVAIVHFWE